MNRILIVLLNFFRFKLYNIFKNNIGINLRQRISYSTHILVRDKYSLIEIRDNLHTKRNVTIQCDGGKIEIGNSVFINENCNIISRESIIIGDNVSIGPNVMIYDHDHDIKNGVGFVCAPIRIDKNVWIGANSVILKGVTIGHGAVIAAGSVIRENVPSKTVAYSNNIVRFKSLQL